MNSLSMDIGHIMKTNVDNMVIKYAEKVTYELSKKYNFNNEDAYKYICDLINNNDNIKSKNREKNKSKIREEKKSEIGEEKKSEIGVNINIELSDDIDYEMIRRELLEKGYCVVPNILSNEDIEYCKELFKEWQTTIPNHDDIHNKISPHGIYKFHGAGHTRYAWYIKTRPRVQNIFKYLWNTDELVVSFDGSCYIPKNLKKKDKIWTHTDQAPNSKGLQCYQGLVALTSNKERTLRLYEGTHLYHEKYFKEKNINSSKNWQLIDHETLHNINDKKRVLHISAGSLVLWDSRIFHQNQYGLPNSEERMVQYVCYLPKNHIKNTTNMQNKRRKYFHDKRTTSHWPCPIYVNGIQPQTYGDNSRLIDYDSLSPPYLDDLYQEIYKLL